MLPIVSEAIIESIREQCIRSDNDEEFNNYIEKTIEEMEEDGQQNLLEAIMSTSKIIADCAMDTMFSEEDKESEEDILAQATDDATEAQEAYMFIFSNCVSLAASVYQSLKQQAICDELE